MSTRGYTRCVVCLQEVDKTFTFSFTSKQPARNNWIDSLCGDDGQERLSLLSRLSVIRDHHLCRTHFSPSDLIHNSIGRRKISLSPNAVPIPILQVPYLLKIFTLLQIHKRAQQIEKPYRHDFPRARKGFFFLLRLPSLFPLLLVVLSPSMPSRVAGLCPSRPSSSTTSTTRPCCTLKRE